jgi:hypothetical protein
MPKQAKDTELIDHATDIRLRAEIGPVRCSPKRKASSARDVHPNYHVAMGKRWVLP